MKTSYIVKGKRRFQKTYGNTYHSVEITKCEEKDGKIEFSTIAYIPFSYGYDDQYKSTGLERLKKNGFIEDEKPYNRHENIEFSVYDVERKKDL